MKTRMVKVLYDHQVFSLQNYGGITAYFEGLIPEMEKHDIHGSLSLLISSNYQISRIKKHLYLSITSKLIKKYFKYIYFLINSIYTIILMKLLGYDVYHATYYETFFLKFIGKKKLVITIYDCTYETEGNSQKWVKRILLNRKKLINRADSVIAISNDVKQDIIKYYKIDPEKIKVIYLFSPLGNKRIKRDQKRSISSRFILYVGTREFNKNFTRFLASFKKISSDFDDIQLICLGGGEFTIEEVSLIERFEISNKIEYRQMKTDQDAIEYFQDALMFVYPSLKEGFGIPIINAFVCGCPVVASNIPVFNEIANDAYLSFDPESVVSMYSSMRKVIVVDAIVQKNIICGYKYAKKYSVDRMTSETAKIYKSLLN